MYFIPPQDVRVQFEVFEGAEKASGKRKIEITNDKIEFVEKTGERYTASLDQVIAFIRNANSK